MPRNAADYDHDYDNDNEVPGTEPRCVPAEDRLRGIGRKEAQGGTRSLCGLGVLARYKPRPREMCLSQSRKDRQGRQASDESPGSTRCDKAHCLIAGSIAAPTTIPLCFGTVTCCLMWLARTLALQDSTPIENRSRERTRTACLPLSWFVPFTFAYSYS